MIKTLQTLFALIGICAVAQAQFSQVNSFGANPGNLAMYQYIPAGISGNAPVVVAMHGCTQDAATYANESGWNTLADQYKFYVVYPQQNSGNNPSKCFNWFKNEDINRGQGEASSIKAMVDYIKTNYSVDNARVFVTGFSAGAAMTTTMLAAYPDVFSSGAVNAGIPYKAATSMLGAFSAMGGNVSKTPAQWGNLVRGQLSSFTGTYPTVAVFHGSSDPTVKDPNLGEITKQWTNVHNTDANADATNNSFEGNPNISQKKYKNNNGKTVVVTYKIAGMGHAIAVDPGTGATQGGQTGAYATDQNFYSSYWTVVFFGIAHNSGGSAPVAPSNLTATPNSSSEITVNWNDNATNETGYIVERSTTTGSGFVQVASLGANASSYTDSGLSPNTTYYYRVRANNTHGNSAYSNQANATTANTSNHTPKAPSGLGAVPASNTQINLTWTDNSSTETEFILERSTTAGSGFTQIASLGANINHYNDVGLTANTTYYYQIKASNAHGYSAYSNQTNATTQPGGGTAYAIAQTSGSFYISTLNNTAMGQSFTVPTSGVITQITVKLYSGITQSTLNIFAGNTTSGTPIYSQTGVNTGAGIQTVLLGTPLAVNAGQSYTFQLSNASIAYTSANAYSGGSYWYSNIQYTVFDAYFVVGITANAGNRTTQQFIAPNQLSMAMYPNPANQLVRFSQLVASVKIVNLHGQVVKQGTNTQALNIERLSAGLYFVQVYVGDKWLVYKLMVNKD